MTFVTFPENTCVQKPRIYTKFPVREKERNNSNRLPILPAKTKHIMKKLTPKNTIAAAGITLFAGLALLAETGTTPVSTPADTTMETIHASLSPEGTRAVRARFILHDPKDRDGKIPLQQHLLDVYDF